MSLNVPPSKLCDYSSSVSIFECKPNFGKMKRVIKTGENFDATNICGGSFQNSDFHDTLIRVNEEENFVIRINFFFSDFIVMARLSVCNNSIPT